MFDILKKLQWQKVVNEGNKSYFYTAEGYFIHTGVLRGRHKQSFCSFVPPARSANTAIGFSLLQVQVLSSDSQLQILIKGSKEAALWLFALLHKPTQLRIGQQALPSYMPFALEILNYSSQYTLCIMQLISVKIFLCSTTKGQEEVELLQINTPIKCFAQYSEYAVPSFYRAFIIFKLYFNAHDQQTVLKAPFLTCSG